MILLSFASAGLYWILYERRGPTWPGSILKTAAILLLALICWYRGGPDLILLGLILGAAGDFALSRPGDKAFLAGMLAFAGGHLAYVAQMWTPAGAEQVWPAGLAMLALAISTEFWLIPHTGALRWPVRVYVVIIAAMGVAAMTLPQDRYIVMIGAALFVLSDLLLAINRFVKPSRLASMAVWPAYWLAQVLILAGSL